jgi:Uma2 family endonuclease
VVDIPSDRARRETAPRSQACVYAFAPVGVIVPGADPAQPDFLLVRIERASIFADDGRIRGVPDLIAEVLSPNNPELVTVTKRAAYARAGVPECWILRPETRDVLVCSRPDPECSDFTDTELFAHDSELVSPTLPIREVPSAQRLAITSAIPARMSGVDICCA